MKRPPGGLGIGKSVLWNYPLSAGFLDTADMIGIFLIPNILFIQSENKERTND